MLNPTKERALTVTPSLSVLDRQLRATIEGQLNAVGSASGLDPLSWIIRSEVDGVSIEGGPVAVHPTNVALCEAWAHALGMTEYRFDLGFDNRTWYLDDGMWHIEVSTEPAI